MSAKLLKSAALVLALGAATTAAAADYSYDYVEGGFGEITDGDGLFVNGSHDVAPNIALAGGVFLGNTDPNSSDVTMLEFGGVYHQPLKSNLGFNAGLKVLHVNVDAGRWGNHDDTGLVASAGLRFRVQPKIELEGDVKYLTNDILHDGLGAQVAGRFYLDPRFSVAAGVAVDTEMDGLFVALRYNL